MAAHVLRIDFLNRYRCIRKIHFLSHCEFINLKYLHFYGRNTMIKYNGIQSKSEHKSSFPAELRKHANNSLALT